MRTGSEDSGTATKGVAGGGSTDRAPIAAVRHGR